MKEMSVVNPEKGMKLCFKRNIAGNFFHPIDERPGENRINYNSRLNIEPGIRILVVPHSNPRASGRERAAQGEYVFCDRRHLTNNGLASRFEFSQLPDKTLVEIVEVPEKK